jgi:hypothetical protein
MACFFIGANTGQLAQVLDADRGSDLRDFQLVKTGSQHCPHAQDEHHTA